MKIRTGFVSNSSSSSFCIFGVYLDSEEIDDVFGFEYDTESDDRKDDERWNKVESLGFDYYGPNDYWDGYYIGVEVSECPDDQTMGDFKKSIIEKINAKAKNQLDQRAFSIMSQGWYNG